VETNADIIETTLLKSELKLETELESNVMPAVPIPAVTNILENNANTNFDIDIDMNYDNQIKKPVLPLIFGYLYKLKHKPSIFGSWTKRYFKTNPTKGTLCYYNNYESSRIPVIQSTINTTNNSTNTNTTNTTTNDTTAASVNAVSKVVPQDNYLRSFDISKGNYTIEVMNECIFQIILKGSIEYILIFKTNTSAEKDIWVKQLQQYIIDLIDYNHTVSIETLTPVLNLNITGLYKLKSIPTAFGTWNMRYFHIKNQQIIYYQTEGGIVHYSLFLYYLESFNFEQF